MKTRHSLAAGKLLRVVALALSATPHLPPGVCLCSTGQLKAESARANMRTAAPSPWTTGTKAILFMRCNFPDDPVEPISEAEATTLMAGVNAFCQENSYGQTTLTTTVTPLLTLPRSTNWYAPESAYGRLIEDALQMAGLAGFRVAEYDLHWVYTRPLTGGPPGRGGVGQKATLLQVNDLGLACHELGHHFGLWHANAWKTAQGTTIGPGTNVEYGDPFCTMGCGSGSLWPFNACEKYALSWLPDRSVQTITSNGVYAIAPSDIPELTDGQIYALRLKKDLAREYWIETRQRFSRDSAWRDALLLTWSPWGASAYGTQLLDTHPNTSTFSDALLLPGEVFFDPELGVKMTTAPAEGSSNGSIHILAQAVSQILLEAEGADTASRLSSLRMPDASGGSCVASTDHLSAQASYAIEVPAPGHYAAWCRLSGPNNQEASLSLSIDGVPGAEARLRAGMAADTWRWMRLSAAVPAQPMLLQAVPIFLAKGSHILRLRLSGAALKLDCMVLTTDPTGNTAPILSPLAAQTIIAGQVGGPIPFSVLDLQSRSWELTVAAASSNTNLLSAANIRVHGDGIDRTLTLTPFPGEVGECMVSVTVSDLDQNQTVVSFLVRVIGLIQAQVEAAKAGETLRIPSGTFYDHVVVEKDLGLEAGPTGNVVLDGAGSGVPLTISANAKVTLGRFTLRNGRGGGVINRGRLTLSECSILDNRRSNGLEGGGVCNSGVLDMDHCVVSRNAFSTGAGLNNRGMARLRDCTIRDNAASQRGGGVLNLGPGQLVIEGSTLAGNRTSDGHGGGICNQGQLSLVNVTISGNDAGRSDPEDDAGLGGGLFNAGIAFLHSCTIAYNRAAVAGGGVANAGTLALGNSLVAANALADVCPSDLCGTIVSHGFNLVQTRTGFSYTGVLAGNLLEVEPLLEPLADHGGPTWTHSLPSHSPAVDAGSGAGLARDQRGCLRPLAIAGAQLPEDGCDIGAFEWNPASSARRFTADPASWNSAPKPRLYVDSVITGRPVRLTLTVPEQDRACVLEVSTNQTAWRTVATRVTGGFVVEWDDVEAGPFSHRFYRAQMLSH